MKFTATPHGTMLQDEDDNIVGWITKTLNDKYFYYKVKFSAYREWADSEEDARLKLLDLIDNQVILSNSTKCLDCGDIIWSAHCHDYKVCSCGECMVDGGQEYMRWLMSCSAVDLCVCWDEVLVKHLRTLELEGLDKMKTLLTIEQELNHKGYMLQDNPVWKTHLEPSELDLHNKNTFGIICSVARYYRDQGYELVRKYGSEPL